MSELDPLSPRCLAPFNPTHRDGVAMALRLLDLDPSDLLVDLGCGDGRLLIEAARVHGCRARGVEYSPELCERAKRLAAEVGVPVQVLLGDAAEHDFSDATAVFVYLVPAGLRLLMPRLTEALCRGARVVSYGTLSLLTTQSTTLRERSLLLTWIDAQRRNENKCLSEATASFR